MWRVGVCKAPTISFRPRLSCKCPPRSRPGRPLDVRPPDINRRQVRVMGKGKIVQVAGPVVDVEFSGSLPGIYHALSVEYKVDDQPVRLTLEVQQHLGDGWVRAISMSGTEGLKRGSRFEETGGPLQMPVGPGVMGRVFDVTGNPVDERGPVEAEKYYPIHRPAPPLVEQSTSPQLLT